MICDRAILSSDHLVLLVDLSLCSEIYAEIHGAQYICNTHLFSDSMQILNDFHLIFLYLCKTAVHIGDELLLCIIAVADKHIAGLYSVTCDDEALAGERGP